jgi:hypothetical protein
MAGLFYHLSIDMHVLEALLVLKPAKQTLLDTVDHISTSTLCHSSRSIETPALLEDISSLSSFIHHFILLLHRL